MFFELGQVRVNSDKLGYFYISSCLINPHSLYIKAVTLIQTPLIPKQVKCLETQSPVRFVVILHKCRCDQQEVAGGL